MVPIDRQIIDTRIARIRNNLRELRDLAKIGQKEFCNDQIAVAAAERMLQTSIEAALDIGNHIIAEKGFEPPMEYREIFITLAQHHIMDKKICDRLVEMVKFRNFVVHCYLQVDSKKVYKIIRDNLGDIESFIKLAVKLLK